MPLAEVLGGRVSAPVPCNEVGSELLRWLGLAVCRGPCRLRSSSVRAAAEKDDDTAAAEVVATARAKEVVARVVSEQPAWFRAGS